RIPQTSAANAVSGRRSRLPRVPENNRGTSRTSEGRGRRTEERTRDRERKGDKADTCKGEAIIFARCQTKTGAAWAAPTDSAVQEEGGWGGQARDCADALVLGLSCGPRGDGNLRPTSSLDRRPSSASGFDHLEPNRDPLRPAGGNPLHGVTREQ
ncbi:unnamed protein product, partial [Ixodes persulcatus]